MNILLSIMAVAIIVSARDLDRSRQVTVFRDRIVVGDVAPHAASKIAQVDLGPSPEPGKKRVLTASFIRDRLRQALAEEVPVDVAKRTEVTRPAQAISELELESRIMAALPQVLPVGFQVSQVDVQGGKVLAEAVFEVAVVLDHKLVQGRNYLRAVLNTPGGDREEIMYVAHVNSPKPADLAVIQRGDQVIIVVRGVGVTVQTAGIAQEKGAQGQKIAVLPQSGAKVVFAKVTDSNHVEVDL